MGRSALKLALLAEKGIDPREKKFKRKVKQAQREKEQVKSKGVEEVDENEADSDEEESGSDGEMDSGDELRLPNIEAIDDTDSESEVEDEQNEFKKPASKSSKGGRTSEPTEDDEDDDDEEEEEDEEEDIPLSDIDADEDREDIIPHTKMTINNKAALRSSLTRIAIDASPAVPFASHQSVTSTKPTADSIPDVSDDLQRELGFLAQSLEAARRGRTLLRKEGVPFTRPSDYFAEMVKDDGQMDRVKAKLVEEATAKKAAAEARKLRDLKKFGKQVQVAKLQERQKAKKDTLDKIKLLKRKRQENGSAQLGTNEADLFDVAVDKELSSYRSGGKEGGGGGGPNAKRQKKNEKYGFGGKKRHSKSGDAMSSGDLSGFSTKKMKGGFGGGGGKGGKPQRPGKSRRKAMGGF